MGLGTYLFVIYSFSFPFRSFSTGRKIWTGVARRVQEEREKENYKRTHGGQAQPLTFKEKYMSCLLRQKKGSRRARKPPSAKETALKKASQLTPKTSEAESSKKGSGTNLRREARGAGSANKSSKKKGGA